MDARPILCRSLVGKPAEQTRSGRGNEWMVTGQPYHYYGEGTEMAFRRRGEGGRVCCENDSRRRRLGLVGVNVETRPRCACERTPGWLSAKQTDMCRTERSPRLDRVCVCRPLRDNTVPMCAVCNLSHTHVRILVCVAFCDASQKENFCATINAAWRLLPRPAGWRPRNNLASFRGWTRS
jgi:hypothetical protein